MFKTIEWKEDRVIILDQTRLPEMEVYRTFDDYRDVAQAIRKLIIRGAPAIGVAAAMGAALGALHIDTTDPQVFLSRWNEICQEIGDARPTAANLFWALERMKRVYKQNISQGIPFVKEALKKEALRIYREDIAINRRIGKEGSVLVKDGDTILTHCNAGALATAGYGTALGVIRAAREEGKRVEVFVDETRPFLQGARLTTWELMKDNIPVTLITDNMAGHFMKEGRINMVVVGADRIAANGDTANKIGTYTLAVLAKENHIPFYIAAPISTIDLDCPSGDKIPIEERSSREIIEINGRLIAPEGVKTAYPAFDVTPHRYITGIITERGVATPPYHKTLPELFDGRASLKH
ncbi:S-methyl-5-thioribose-1-phosphate isomerase [bacterium (candidate division B38) B3_B38]|nr:MAG: S-methyl-5-thioribose-1-phosphate isomerase [bacterium (candidate division B38) B3_B38]